jgi:hypothetical protein
MSKFIHIRSEKFPVLPGEGDEIVNDGMYGKALALYLQSKLTERGYKAPFVVAEDWGWWVDIDGPPFTFGVCIYASPDAPVSTEFVCTDGAPGPRKWSWSKFRFFDTGPLAERLCFDLIAVFEADDDISVLSVTEEFPF